MREVTYEAEFFQDTDKATEIARILYDQFRNKTGFFQSYEMPEYIPPAGLDRPPESTLFT